MVSKMTEIENNDKNDPWLNLEDQCIGWYKKIVEIIENHCKQVEKIQ
jgi:hypothetical protein